ncbi:hypothetical protein HH800_06985 [Sphingobium yanoikuyae]|uniref:Uncharacterized protein n=1 Tax=Sphingobium yanoikuyae TaxID=13690 RepID=A0A6M4G4X8_SPHYA|nr:hypothetical protein [Sphingobium yanoikuyae]QJR01966.1 hypothetical protein HH800_06985 [Sphingobium yanoikuyae]
MDNPSLQIDWAAGKVVNGEMLIPATFGDLTGALILPEHEMLAASEAADDEVLVAYGGMIGWIADAAEKALARGALVEVEQRFRMLISRADFSVSRPSIN